MPLTFSLEYPLLQRKWMWWHSTMLLFLDLDGLHVSEEIGFSVPRGLKPLVFGDKCLLCGNAVWLTDRAQSLIPPLPPHCTWINHLHGKATVLCRSSCLELNSLFKRADMAVRLTLKNYNTNRSSIVYSPHCHWAMFNTVLIFISNKNCTCSGESYCNSESSRIGAIFLNTYF